MLRNVSILIKTKNQQQTRDILKLTFFYDNVNINVSLHRSLNISKGIMYSHLFKNIEGQEILEGIKDQNVI